VILAWLANTDAGRLAQEQVEQAYLFWFGTLMEPGAVAEFYSNVDFAYDWIAYNLIFANNAQGVANFSAAEQQQLIELLESVRLEALQKYGNTVDGAEYLWTQFGLGASQLTQSESFLNVLGVAVDGSKAAAQYQNTYGTPSLDLPWWVWAGLGLSVLTLLKK